MPSYSTPNHLYAQSATSCGIDDNINYNQCGGSSASFPMRTVYDNLRDAGVPFAFYSNNTVRRTLRHAHTPRIHTTQTSRITV